MMRHYDIWAACAISETGFAVSIGDFEEDPQFSRLCVANGMGMEPWVMHELESTVVSLARLPIEGKAPIVIGLGIDGEVFWVGQSTSSERIPEAGASDDEPGRGSMSQIRVVGNEILACGYGSQVYSRQLNSKWQILCGEEFDGVGDACLEAVARGNGRSIIACGYRAAGFREPTEAEQAELDRIAEDGTMAEYLAAKERFESMTDAASGCLFIGSGTSWESVQLPGNGYLNDAVACEDGSLIAVGGGGLILVWSAREILENRSQPGFLETYHSACRIGSQIYLLADTVIHVLDGNLELFEEITLPDGMESPLSIDSFQDVLWYFDNRGVARRLGSGWEIVQLPGDAWEIRPPKDEE